MRMPQIKNEKGTSLIELLVAMTLFTVMILASTQIFKTVIDGQRSAISAQNVQESIRFAMEKISKEIRMAQISDAVCLPSAVNKVFNTAGGGSELYFKNKDNVCVGYFLENNRLKIRIRKVSGGSVFEDFITPLKTEVSNLKFNVVDDPIGAFHSLQPYVTMMMDIKAVGLAIHEQKMKLQFTVSSRYYE